MYVCSPLFNKYKYTLNTEKQMKNLGRQPELSLIGWAADLLDDQHSTEWKLRSWKKEKKNEGNHTFDVKHA